MCFRRLEREVSFAGRGLHTGEECRVTLSPGDEGEGVLLAGRRGIYSADNWAFTGAGRGTEVFLPDGTSVKTPEHLFAALAGLGIWSVRIGVEGPEIPALDGCSAAFAKVIEANSAPVRSNEKGPEPLALSCPLAVENRARKAAVFAFPSDELLISYVITYEGTAIGTQAADYRRPGDDFSALIAPARTFALESEVKELLGRGLAKGGGAGNAIVAGESSVSAEGGLRFPDEFVRHKILDLMGDLYLLGRPLRARIVALRAGHDLHCRLAERILSASGSKKFRKKEKNHA